MNDTIKRTNKAVTAAFILKIVAVVLLSVIILVNVLTIVLSKLDLRRTLKWFPGAFVTIETGSMEPLLHTGDLIFVWGTSFEDLNVGDVVTVYTGEEFITHGVSRIEDEAVITKGLANEQEDLPLDEREYVAKMLYVIPGGAFAWELFSSTGFTILLILLLGLLIFSVPLCKWIYHLSLKTGTKRKIRVGALRVVSFTALASLLLTSPYFSSGKYKAQIDDQFPSEAKAVYFTSNYLSAGEGSYSHIQGWNGKTYEFHLIFRNYDNELLYNTTDTDLQYKVRIDNVSVSTDTVLNQFEFIVKEGNAASPLQNASTTDMNSGFYGIYTPSEVLGGSPVDSQIYVTLQSKLHPENDQNTLMSLGAGVSISFTVTAWTENENYNQVLSARYVIDVTDDTQFISDITAPQKAGTAVFTVSMKSNQVPGISSRRIRYVWDPTYVYLNEYDATAMYLKKTGVFNKEEGWLEISVQPLSTINLQFFKRRASMNITVLAEYVPGDGSVGSYDKIIISPTDINS